MKKARDIKVMNACNKCARTLRPSEPDQCFFSVSCGHMFCATCRATATSRGLPPLTCVMCLKKSSAIVSLYGDAMPARFHDFVWKTPKQILERALTVLGYREMQHKMFRREMRRRNASIAKQLRTTKSPPRMTSTAPLASSTVSDKKAMTRTSRMASDRRHVATPHPEMARREHRRNRPSTPYQHARSDVVPSRRTSIERRNKLPSSGRRNVPTSSQGVSLPMSSHTQGRDRPLTPLQRYQLDRDQRIMSATRRRRPSTGIATMPTGLDEKARAAAIERASGASFATFNDDHDVVRSKRPLSTFAYTPANDSRATSQASTKMSSAKKTPTIPMMKRSKHFTKHVRGPKDRLPVRPDSSSSIRDASTLQTSHVRKHKRKDSLRSVPRKSPKLPTTTHVIPPVSTSSTTTIATASPVLSTGTPTLSMKPTSTTKDEATSVCVERQDGTNAKSETSRAHCTGKENRVRRARPRPRPRTRPRPKTSAGVGRRGLGMLRPLTSRTTMNKKRQ